MSVMSTSVKRLIVFGGEDCGKLSDTMDIQRKLFGYLKTPTHDTFRLFDWFNTIVGVLQGCVLSPLLFSIFLEVIIALALDA